LSDAASSEGENSDPRTNVVGIKFDALKELSLLFPVADDPRLRDLWLDSLPESTMFSSLSESLASYCSDESLLISCSLMS
jgi:hypothetical protein